MVGFVSAAAFAVLLTVIPMGDAYPGGNGMIAYTHHPSGESASVHTINPDGSGDATLEADSTSRAWSPDGNKLLFNRFPVFGSPDIWVVNADGTGTHQLTSGFPAWSASWSPDGTQIAYKHSSADNAASGELWTMDADGSNQNQITDDGLAKYNLAWGMSSSGSKIGYFGFRPDVLWGLFTINPDGSDQAYASGVSGDLAFSALDPPDWSPDGTKLVFSAHDNSLVTLCDGESAYPIDLYVYDFSTNTATDVSNTRTGDGPYETTPSWSPDGTKIAFAAYSYSCVNGQLRVSSTAIYSMNATGGGVVQITHPDQDTVDSSPTWQPCQADTIRCTSMRPRPPPPPPPPPPPRLHHHRLHHHRLHHHRLHHHRLHHHHRLRPRHLRPRRRARFRE
jgi:dipeptidyl aminopeptidase/acylaminoacyl peptidase